MSYSMLFYITVEQSFNCREGFIVSIFDENLECEVSIGDEVIAAVRAIMPPDYDFLRLSDLYKMFSDPTRARILWALGSSEMCVCDLAELLGMTKSAISHQLKSLRLGNLVKFERRGKNIIYSLADNHVKLIFSMGIEHIHE